MSLKKELLCAFLALPDALLVQFEQELSGPLFPKPSQSFRVELGLADAQRAQVGLVRDVKLELLREAVVIVVATAATFEVIVAILLGGEAREHVLQVGHGLLDLRLGHHWGGGRRSTCGLSATHALAQLALRRGQLRGHAGQGT